MKDAGQANRLQQLAVEGSRLGVPLIFGFDVIHGMRTILPSPIATAASWDPEVAEAGQRVAAREARATSIHWTFAAGVAVPQRLFASMFDDHERGRLTASPEGFDQERELDRAVGLASQAGVAIVVVGQPQNMSGEKASASTLDLPGRQLELLRRV